jgi:hypothetical protein
VVPPASSATAKNHRHHTTAAGVLYVSDPLDEQVLVYQLGGISPLSPIATITTGIDKPGALTTDAAGDLFVANAGNNTVEEYLHGQTTPKLAVGHALDPLGLAIDAQGNLWVSQLARADAYFGQVEEYAYNATTQTFSQSPSVRIAGTGSGELLSPHGLAFDSGGTLFIADPSRHGYIFKVARGAKTTQAILLPEAPPLATGAPATIEGPLDVKVSGSGASETLYVTDALLGGVYGISQQSNVVTWDVQEGSAAAGCAQTYLAVNSAGTVYSTCGGSLVFQAYPAQNVGFSGLTSAAGLATGGSF